MADSRLGKMRMTRSRRRMLAGIRERDPEPLTRQRPLERRWLGTCRDFAVLLCALLRAHRRPARVRYGFATYFAPGVNTDHVVCEVWNAEDDRWRLVDPMIDDFPRAAYAIHVDTHDPPVAAFVPAGRGWQWCREGRARPGQFGIGRRAPRGIGFVRSGLLRDVAALNVIEPLCQEEWDPGPGSAVAARLDQLANWTLAPEAHLDNLRAAYDETVRGLVAAAPPRG